MNTDSAIQIDLLSKIEAINTNMLSEIVFLNTLLILQYKLCLDFWSYFSKVNDELYDRRKSFSSVNDMLASDINRLKTNVINIIDRKKYTELICIREYKIITKMMDTINSTLGYAMAFGKVGFWSRTVLGQVKGNITYLNTTSMGLINEFIVRLKEAPLKPSDQECQLFNIDKKLYMTIYESMEIRNAPHNLLKKWDASSLNLAFKYGKIQ